MRRHSPIRLFCTLLLASWIAAVLPGVNASAQQAGEKHQKASMTPQQAAKKARAKHGGKVLKVSRKGNAYRVKLLKESGRVVTVTIRD